jgi:hypothetical protein
MRASPPGRNGGQIEGVGLPGITVDGNHLEQQSSRGGRIRGDTAANPP